MPELPEVETIRRDLDPLVAGRRIEAVEVDPATLPLLARAPIEALRSSLVGRAIVSTGRRGKYLLFGLDDGRTFAAHLRMTGRLVWRESSAPPEPYERAKLVLDGGHDLRWSDLRKFGTWRLYDSLDELDARLGPEPIDESFTLRQFAAALAGRTAPVKAVLLDQRRMAGLGNIYVDEALWHARLHPLRPAGSLAVAELRSLHRAIRKALELGIARQGSTLTDYRLPDGSSGSMQKEFRAYGRVDEPCDRCGTPIAKTRAAGRGTWFCPTCQRRD